MNILNQRTIQVNLEIVMSIIFQLKRIKISHIKHLLACFTEKIQCLLLLLITIEVLIHIYGECVII